jgi:hypothetical protein
LQFIWCFAGMGEKRLNASTDKKAYPISAFQFLCRGPAVI